MNFQASMIVRRYMQPLLGLSVLLVASVFALGLHTKLALYKPGPSSILLTLTKLSIGNRPKAVMMQEAKPEADRTNLPLTTPLPHAMRPFLTRCSARQNRQIGSEVTWSMKTQYTLRFHKPPPAHVHDGALSTAALSI